MSLHRRLLEDKGGVFAALTTLVILIGGVAEIVPMYAAPSDPNTPQITPYSPLEQAGRDIYVREGCYTCHSQMVRPMVAEYLRYGEASRPEEFIYDHPFQWGSKRTGPDLHRIGGKYPSLWH